MSDIEYQRDVTRLALGALAENGFALAGSGAIREHGIIDRPTQDIDLFTSVTSVEAFTVAATRLADTMREQDLEVVQRRIAPQFASFSVISTTGQAVEVDLGVDWRAAEPVTLSIGPVLSLEDAVASKVVAVYSRAEVRDYLDLDAIRESGRFTDAQLLDLAAERDPGFDAAVFAGQLQQIQRITTSSRVQEYGVGDQELAQLKVRLLEWAGQLQGNRPGSGLQAPEKAQQSAAAVDTGLEQVMKLVHTTYPVPAHEAVKPTGTSSVADAKSKGIYNDRGQGRQK